MGRNRFLLLAALCAMAVPGCNHSTDPSASQSSSELIPLAAGNQWIYQTTTFDPQEQIIRNYKDTVSIRDIWVIEGERWYNIPTVGMVRAEANLADGFWVYLSNETYANAYPYVRYPLAVGNIDTLEHFNDGTEPESWSIARVASLNSGITVPCGTFICRVVTEGMRSADGHYSTAEMDTTAVQWYAPNVGRVRTDEYYSTSTGSRYLASRRELISYILH